MRKQCLFFWSLIDTSYMSKKHMSPEQVRWTELQDERFELQNHCENGNVLPQYVNMKDQVERLRFVKSELNKYYLERKGV